MLARRLLRRSGRSRWTVRKEEACRREVRGRRSWRCARRSTGCRGRLSASWVACRP